MKNKGFMAIAAVAMAITLTACDSDSMNGSESIENKTSNIESIGVDNNEPTLDSGSEGIEDKENTTSAERVEGSGGDTEHNESGDNDTSGSAEQSEVDETSEDDKQSDSILDDVIKIGDESYRLGCSVKAFTDNGWSVVPADTDLEGLATAIGAKLEKNGDKISFTPFNNTTKLKNVEDCIVVGVEINQTYIENVDTISYMGITLNKSTAADVMDKFGETTREYHSDTSDYHSYTYELSAGDSLEFTESDGVISRITVRKTSQSSLRELMD